MAKGNLLSTQANSPAISPATMVAAVVALAALGFTLGATLLPALAAMALLGAVVVRRPLAADAQVLVAGRIAVYTLSAWWMWARFNSEDAMNAEIVLALGLGLAAAGEMVLQAWSAGPWFGNRGESLLALSAVVIMGAANTFDAGAIRFFVPLYMAALICALRACSSEPGNSDSALQTANRGAAALSASAVAATESRAHLASRRGTARLCGALALICGIGLYVMVWAYRFELGQMGARLFSPGLFVEPSGLDTAPRLGVGTSQVNATLRMYRLSNWPADQHYLRVMSFDSYTAGSWGPPLESRHFTALQPGGSISVASEAMAPARVDRLVSDGGLVAVPPSGVAFNWPAGVELQAPPHGDGPLRTHSLDGSPLSYDVALGAPESAPLAGAAVGPLNAADQARYLALPPGFSPAAIARAHGLNGANISRQERVRRVVDYLQMCCRYSTQSRPGPGDSVANFIVHCGKGNCECFAAAATLMLRSLKVPTRYVIGYYVNSDAPGSTVTVRLRDAHAWCESYLDGRGWVTVDATPAGGRSDRYFASVGALQQLREWLSDVLAQLWAVLTGSAGVPHLPAGWTWPALGLLGAALAAASLGIKIWRQRRQGRQPGYSNRPELVPPARRFLRLLKRCGAPCPRQLPWRDHLDALCRGGAPDDYPLLDIAQALAFVHRYNQARFAAPRAHDIRQLDQMLVELEASRRASKTKRPRHSLATRSE